MSHRQVFSAASVAQAAEAVGVAREAGLSPECVSLIARSDIELSRIPDDYKIADTDFVPAALRGAGFGAVAGTVAGLVAAAFPPLGLTLAGAMLGGGAAGALVGTWTSALVGSSIPDPVRREYEAEIEAGRILVVLDAEEDALHALAPAIERTGARALDAPVVRAA